VLARFAFIRAASSLQMPSVCHNPSCDEATTCARDAEERKYCIMQKES